MTDPRQEFYAELDQMTEPLMKLFNYWSKNLPVATENLDAETQTIVNCLFLIASGNIVTVGLLRRLIQAQIEGTDSIIEGLDDIYSAINMMDLTDSAD